MIPGPSLHPYQLPRAGALQGKLRLGAYPLYIHLFGFTLELRWD